MPLNLPFKRGPWEARQLNDNFRRIHQYFDGGLESGSGTEARSEIGIRYAIKAGTTTRNNDAALSADPDLVLNLGAGYWKLSGLLSYTAASATPDIQWDFSEIDASVSGWVIFMTTGSADAYNIAGAGVTSISSMPGGLSVRNFVLEGMVKMPAQGDMALEWAQAVADPTDTNLQAGSWISAQRATT